MCRQMSPLGRLGEFLNKPWPDSESYYLLFFEMVPQQFGPFWISKHFPTFSQYMRWSCFFFLLLIEYLLNFFFGQLQIDLGSSSTPRYKKLRLEGWFSVMWQLLHYITIENGSWNFSELKLLFLAAQLYTYTWMVTEWPFSFLLFSYRFQMVDCGCVQFCMNIKRLMSHSSKS